MSFAAPPEMNAHRLATSPVVDGIVVGDEFIDIAFEFCNGFFLKKSDLGVVSEDGDLEAFMAVYVVQSAVVPAYKMIFPEGFCEK